MICAVSDDDMDLPPFFEDPVAVACAAVVLALLLCLAVALFVRHQYNSGIMTEKMIKRRLENIPTRCYCCMNPSYKRPKRKPLPRLNVYIPEVTEKYIWKPWEPLEVSQTCAPPSVEDLL
mmetsp:Transcript_16467/g.39178  ORF Transcript_16467/g.39178 Transcript_16467/m.39178 type:complete len:120 (-) Transcript_16467:166-525(-)